MSCNEGKCRRIKRELADAQHRTQEVQRELDRTRALIPTATLNRVDLVLDAENIGPKRLRGIS